MKGVKHLIKCRCVLPHLKAVESPPEHMFVVFSVIVDDHVKPKFAQCNNCGIVHKVIDLCTSEIVFGKEHMSSIVTLDEVKAGIPATLAKMLESNNVDLASWEAAAFALEQRDWTAFVVLTTDKDDASVHGKYVRILGENLFKIESFSRETEIKR